MHNAVEKGDVQEVERLLSTSVIVNSTTREVSNSAHCRFTLTLPLKNVWILLLPLVER